MKVGTAEMAKFLSYSIEKVRVMARRGELKATKDCRGHWQFDLNDYLPKKKVRKMVVRDDRLLLTRVIKKTGVDKEVIDQAIEEGDLEVVVDGRRTYIVDELELYYLTCRWKRLGLARLKWSYAGIPPHLAGKMMDFVVDVMEEMDAKKRLSPTG